MSLDGGCCIGASSRTMNLPGSPGSPSQPLSSTRLLHTRPCVYARAFSATPASIRLSSNQMRPAHVLSGRRGSGAGVKRAPTAVFPPAAGPQPTKAAPAWLSLKKCSTCASEPFRARAPSTYPLASVWILMDCFDFQVAATQCSITADPAGCPSLWVKFQRKATHRQRGTNRLAVEVREILGGLCGSRDYAAGGQSARLQRNKTWSYCNRGLSFWLCIAKPCIAGHANFHGLYTRSLHLQARMAQQVLPTLFTCLCSKAF